MNTQSRESVVPARDESYVLLVVPVIGKASEIVIAADDFSERMLRAIETEHPLSKVRQLSSPLGIVKYRRPALLQAAHRLSHQYRLIYRRG